MRSISAACAMTALLALGCGESRQAKFEKAMHAAEVARTALDAARESFASHEAAYEEARNAAAEAEAKLAVARQKLDAATASLDAAQAEVAKWADDASVSRVLQQRLLDERALAVAAISARVENGIALLEGSAPDAATRERAVAIAHEVPGVVDVQSQVAVAVAAPAPSAGEVAAPTEDQRQSTEPAEPTEAPH